MRRFHSLSTHSEMRPSKNASSLTKTRLRGNDLDETALRKLSISLKETTKKRLVLSRDMTAHTVIAGGGGGGGGGVGVRFRGECLDRMNELTKMEIKPTRGATAFESPLFGTAIQSCANTASQTTLAKKDACPLTSFFLRTLFL